MYGLGKRYDKLVNRYSKLNMIEKYLSNKVDFNYKFLNIFRFILVEVMNIFYKKERKCLLLIINKFFN